MMEDWQYQEDKSLANPPEGEESRFICNWCKEPFEPHDRLYTLDGFNLCIGCAHEWLEEQCRFVSEGECNGEL